MKYLKYLIITLFITVAGFFLLGFIKSEISYACEIIIDKPIVECWAVSQDEEKMKDWLEGFQKIEQVSGTPRAVGAISDVYFNTDGQDMTIRETITGIVPGESITMIFETDFMNMDYKLSMQSIAGKTKISSKTTAVGNGMVSKSIIALMAGSFTTQEKKNLNSLKQTIENNTKNYSND